MSKKLTVVFASSTGSELTIRDFLFSHSTGVIATSDRGGSLHSSVVYYQPTHDLQLMIVTKEETQKYKNLMQTSLFVMTIYDEKSQVALDVSGSAHEVTDENEQRLVIANMTNISLIKSGREIPPIDKLIAGDYAVFRLAPFSLRLAVYPRPNEENEDLFETLILA